jgi:hypothetical protein
MGSAQPTEEDFKRTPFLVHEDKPQSMYDNPQAYPQMFPWLFPYGPYGGIGQARLKKKVSETEHKKHLLMYHDKRFQTDLYFPAESRNYWQFSTCKKAKIQSNLTETHVLGSDCPVETDKAIDRGGARLRRDRNSEGMLCCLRRLGSYRWACKRVPYKQKVYAL